MYLRIVRKCYRRMQGLRGAGERSALAIGHGLAQVADVRAAAAVDRVRVGIAVDRIVVPVAEQGVVAEPPADVVVPVVAIAAPEGVVPSQAVQDVVPVAAHQLVIEVGAYATEAEAILATLAWFGHGAGPWNGFPSYEGAAESLLLLHPTERIVEALRSAELTPAHLEGAARLFASWWFAHMRPADIDLVPGELKRRLMEHVEASGDGDKMGRLRRALRGGRV